MANRTTLKSNTPGPITGDQFLDNAAGHIDLFYGLVALPLTNIEGTVDAVTADLDPPLLVADTMTYGMKFEIEWAGANTGPVTVSVNGGTSLAVIRADGTALSAGELDANLISILFFDGQDLRIISSGGIGDNARVLDRQEFLSSGTWNRPADTLDDQLCLVELWAGGGGGGANSNGINGGGGGGGGGYVSAILRLGDIASSVSIVIGAGGNGSPNGTGGVGGNTTFGTLLTAYGGGGGTLNVGSPSAGGGGGGAVGPGGTGVGGEPDGGSTGIGARDGGGGGGAGDTNPNPGGNTVNGGGGGGGGRPSIPGPGGTSMFGGDGGQYGAVGSVPGGGGGGSANGASGMARISLL